MSDTPMQGAVKKQRGGDRGGRRPKVGDSRNIKIEENDWQHCLAQPGGAAAHIRRLIKRDRLKTE